MNIQAYRDIDNWNQHLRRKEIEALALLSVLMARQIIRRSELK
jgi:hypothetical protein